MLRVCSGFAAELACANPDSELGVIGDGLDRNGGFWIKDCSCFQIRNNCLWLAIFLARVGDEYEGRKTNARRKQAQHDKSILGSCYFDLYSGGSLDSIFVRARIDGHCALGAKNWW